MELSCRNLLLNRLRVLNLPDNEKNCKYDYNIYYPTYSIKRHIVHILGTQVPALAKSAWTHKGARYDWGWNGEQWRNWSDTVNAKPLAASFPRTKNEIVDIMKHANANKTKLRFVGASCSPGPLAQSQHHMVFANHLNKILWIDAEKKHVRVQSGISFVQLNEALSEVKLGFPILPSVSEPSVGGSLATAIHGTGAQFPSLAAFVESFELITPSGDILECNATTNQDIFNAGRCNIGALGFVSEVTLRVESEFKLRAKQELEDLDEVLTHLTETIFSSQHTRFWWIPHTNKVVLWKADIVPIESPNRSINDWIRRQNRFFNYCYESLIYSALWSPTITKFSNWFIARFILARPSEIIDRSDRVFNFDCLFRQYVDEWILPAKELPRLLRRMKKLLERHPDWAADFPIEVRFQKADNIWLSPAYKEKQKAEPLLLASSSSSSSEVSPSTLSSSPLDDVFACVGVIAYRPFGHEPPKYWKEWFQAFEDLVFDLGGRPHWSKEAALDSRYLNELYPKWNDFLKLRQQLDPNGILLNEWLSNIIDPNWESPVRKYKKLQKTMIWSRKG